MGNRNEAEADYIKRAIEDTIQKARDSEVPLTRNTWCLIEAAESALNLHQHNVVVPIHTYYYILGALHGCITESGAVSVDEVDALMSDVTRLIEGSLHE